MAPRDEKASRTRGRGRATRRQPRWPPALWKKLLHSTAILAPKPAQRRRRPPVPVTEQRHQARHEQRPDERGVDRNGHRDPEPQLLDDQNPRRDEGADRDAEEERGGGDDAPGSLEAERHRLAVREPRVVRLLDAREQEDAVVGREAERDREQ